jgi:hypothetical protein
MLLAHDELNYLEAGNVQFLPDETTANVTPTEMNGFLSHDGGF